MKSVIIIIPLMFIGCSQKKLAATNHDRTAEELASFKDPLLKFRHDLGRFPTEAEGVDVLWSKNLLQDSSDKWLGPYANYTFFKNSGAKYFDWYKRPIKIQSSENEFRMTSAGDDGKFDTPDDIIEKVEFK